MICRVILKFRRSERTGLELRGNGPFLDGCRRSSLTEEITEELSNSSEAQFFTLVAEVHLFFIFALLSAKPVNINELKINEEAVERFLLSTRYLRLPPFFTFANAFSKRQGGCARPKK